ncbi:ROK family protein [Paramaledivibacter caminithermalis]|jgi:glucokinase|uniref:Glucokinase n=1 Tax=Paramaledivibacter caminithermalis (strain DSM 15212 / CIP 107654 / DViRD3) TaxID=1121301 RepID=A0A1M6QQ15_PARC5|nr:ROK family glucokinase [Paramaledivibacter caminithermalis]SHK22296.1 glucokinase [Paramaledivibacter caminithermalis DSM 15212]
MYVGVDLGGTNIAAGIVDEKGDLKYQKSIPTKAKRNPKEIINDIRDLVLDLIKEYGLLKDEVEAIGIGIPGLADEDGNVIFCVNLGWKNVPLAISLNKQLGIPIYIDNDATVAALAEYECGVMMGAESGILLTLGTGIGGGIILNGKVYSGYNGVGSEIGHMVVGNNFYDCNCGRNGCLETFSSSTAIIRYTEKLLKESKNKGLIYKRIHCDSEELNAKLIFDCAKMGDEIAQQAVKRLVKYLSLGIINLINILDPQIIALGGGVANAGKYLLDLVIEDVKKNQYYKELPIGKIVLARLGNEAGVIGAAMLGKQ